MCDANVSYIGKTKRHLTVRVKEHLVGQSAIAKHVDSCEDCKKGYTLNQFSVLSQASSDYECRIREALFIKEVVPSLNNQLVNLGSSYFLKLF